MFRFFNTKKFIGGGLHP